MWRVRGLNKSLPNHKIQETLNHLKHSVCVRDQLTLSMKCYVKALCPNELQMKTFMEAY